jgi:L-2-hydroxyglutarate oxidase LhgO
MARKKRIVIVGGGAVGTTAALDIARYTHNEVILLDKQPITRAKNQSSHNSGVNHAGIYYPRKTMPEKFELCHLGNQMHVEFSREHKTPVISTGKLIVAPTPQWVPYLMDVKKIAEDRGVPIEFLVGEEAKKYEKNVSVSAALYAPTSGILDAPSYIKRLVYLLKKCSNFESGLLNDKAGYEVLDINEKGSGFELEIRTTDARKDTFALEADVVINCAGLYCDDIARMINPDSPYEVDPIKGELCKFYKTRRDEIWHDKMNVYPAPHGLWENGERADIEFEEFQRLLETGEIFKTVGVHLTPTFETNEAGEYVIGRTVTVGPAFVGNVGKEDYKFTMPIEHFHEHSIDYFPGLRISDLEEHDVGIMARLKGHLDFKFTTDPNHENFYNCLGLDSPALTCAPAIARYRILEYVMGL